MRPISRVSVLMLVLVVFVGCSTLRRIGLDRIGMTTTTIKINAEGTDVEVVSKSDSKVEFVADKDGIKSVVVDNQGRPGLPERLVESLANRTDIVLGSGVDSVTQKDSD